MPPQGVQSTAIREAPDDPPGAGVTCRGLEPDDEPAVRRLADRCSARCLRDRFFGYVADPAELVARQLLEASSEGYAVGAIADDAMVAVAVGLPDRSRAVWELGVLVHDDWQGRGLGRRLSSRVLVEADCAGATPVAVVEGANVRALRLVRRLRLTAEGAALSVELC
jgi:GNAT superfamily N-acetyltransferase